MTIILVFLLFLLPLFIIPYSLSPFEAPKVILAEILIEILLFLFIVRASTASRELLLSSRRTSGSIKYYLLSALFLLSLIHLIFLKTPTTFFGNPFRLQGVFLLWHLLIFSTISKNIKLDHVPKFIYPLSILGLLIGALIMGGNEAGRAVGTLGEPNALAATAIFIWPFAFLNPLGTKKWFKPLYPLITLIILILSGSRSGLLAFAIQIIFLTITKFNLITIGKTVILSIILLAFSSTMPLIEGGGWFENRSEVWSTALSAGLQQPIFGSGFGNMEYALKDASRLINNNIQYQYVDSSHNFLLDYFVQGGLLGTGLIISILFLSLLGLTRNNNRLLISAFIGVLTVMSFNPVSVVTLLAFWYLISQGFRVFSVHNSAKERYT